MSRMATGDVQDGRQTLRAILTDRYEWLINRLTRHLGSADLAGDALHDTWLRLERDGEFGEVRDPVAYLLRTATNADHQRRRIEQRRLRLLDQHDAAPSAIADLNAELESRSDLEAMKRAIGKLPERRREVFLAIWVEKASPVEIAARHGVTVRTIQMELKRALEDIAALVKENS